MFALPDVRLLAASTNLLPIALKVLNVASQAWSTVDPAVLDGGSAVVYRPGKILKSGSSRDPHIALGGTQGTTYALDMTSGAPAWRSVGSMAFGRRYHYLTVLPDGDVLATGGGLTTGAVDVSSAVNPAELWSPVTENWTAVASMHAPRLYHSTALLLPDGRALIGGGGRFSGVNEPTDQPSAEIFAPPYLFKGPRPVIASAPAEVGYAQVFNVQSPDATRVSKAVLVAPGSVTHGFDQNQRYVELSYTASTGSVSITAPASGNVAPPGKYMLFLIDNLGVPSIAAMVGVVDPGGL